MSKINDLIKELCPNGVEYKKYGEVFEIKTGKGITTKDASKDGLYPIISGGTAPMGLYDEYNREANNVTVSRVGANAGYVSFISEKFYLNDKCFSIISKRTFSNLLMPKFIYHYTKNMEKEIMKLQSEGGVPTINTQKVSNLLIPIPPLEVQKEIVQILDKFGELESELESELEVRKSQYEFWRGKLLKGTRKYKLDDIAKFTYGFTDKTLEDGTARYIRITDISENGYLLNDDCKYLNISNDNSKYVLNNGDLVVARTGASYGKTLYFDSDVPGIYASFLIKIELDNNVILNRYYWHFSKSSLYWKQANNLVSKAGQPQFNSNAIKKIEIDLPSIEEQKRIITILDKFEKLINDITEGIPAEIEFRKQQYEYYRNKLLNFKEVQYER